MSTCFVLLFGDGGVPDNLKQLLKYKQEPTCHIRRLTTASAYLRLLINLDDNQKCKLLKLISYIVSMYVPSFFNPFKLLK